MSLSREKEKTRRIKQIQSKCIHFTGIQHETCKAGVNYREIVGGEDLGWAIRTPCFEDNKECVVTCNHREFPTYAEAQAEEDRQEAAMERFWLACNAAHEDAEAKGFKRGNGGRSSMPCPIAGCSGQLNYSVASVNGHMHAACTRSGCVSWME